MSRYSGFGGAPIRVYRTPLYESPTRVCACGCGLRSYAKFRPGHSVQNYRKACRQRPLPLGGKAGKRVRKRKRRKRAQEQKWSRQY